MVLEVFNNPDGCCHASCEQMSQWIHISFNEIKLSDRMIAYNSRKHHQFTYFPNEPVRAAAAPPIVPAPQVLATSLPAPERRDSGWNDTNDSTSEPSTFESE